MSTRPQNMDAAEFAQRYALGELDEADRARFEERLSEGDAELLAEWNALRPGVEAMLREVTAVAPSSAVFEQIRARMGDLRESPAFAAIDESNDPVASDTENLIIRRADAEDWTDSEVPGVQMRNLFVDRETGRLTILIRMAAGAVYPDHEHPGAEECLVLEGDLSIAGTVLRAGDYLRTPAGGVHGEPRTTGGCLLLVTTPFDAAA